MLGKADILLERIEKSKKSCGCTKKDGKCTCDIPCDSDLSIEEWRRLTPREKRARELILKRKMRDKKKKIKSKARDLLKKAKDIAKDR